MAKSLQLIPFGGMNTTAGQYASAMGKTGFTIDVKSAIGDFRAYDKATQRRFVATLAKIGGLVATDQWHYLKSKAKTWTNRIGSTIGASKVKDMTVYVGPSERVAYGWFLEEGASANQQARGNMFAGYHFVRNTLKKWERRLIVELRKDIQNAGQ